MTALFFQLVGGIGLFLLGMVLLTDGLKTFAGETLRRMLVQFTGTPLKAFGSGALCYGRSREPSPPGAPSERAMLIDGGSQGPRSGG